MAKLQYQCTMSLDGFIAGPGGDMSWLAAHLGPDPTAERIMRQTGALLVGRRTFDGDDPHKGTEHEGEPYGGGWDGPQFVLTHRVPDAPVPGVTFATDLDTVPSPQPRRPRVTATSASWAPGWPPNASGRGCSTSSTCPSCPSCWATAPGCSTTRAAPGSGSNNSNSPRPPGPPPSSSASSADVDGNPRGVEGVGAPAVMDHVPLGVRWTSS